jgi:hypothetical protein
LDAKLGEAHEKETGPHLSARIIYTPSVAGTYRLIVTSSDRRGRGTYTLRIRSFKGEAADKAS